MTRPPILNGVAGAALRPAVASVRVNRCENCAFVGAPNQGSKTPTCRGKMPEALAVPVGIDQKTGLPVMVVRGFWPPVGPDEYCHQHKPRIANMQQTPGEPA